MEESNTKLIFAIIAVFVVVIAVVGVLLLGNFGEDQTPVIPENKAPIVTASADKTNVETYDDISFTGVAIDQDGSVVKYEWDFDGDGTYDWNSSSVSTTHDYEDDGTYVAKLRATDNNGTSASSTVTITVANRAPMSSPSADSTHIYATETVTFDGDTLSKDIDGTIVSYEWDFGDSITSDEKRPTHTYDEPGEYTVNLTVTDDDGVTGSDTLTVYVSNDIEISIEDHGLNSIFNSTGDYFVKITMSNYGNNDASTDYLWFDLEDSSGGKYTAVDDSGGQPNSITKDGTATWTLYFDLSGKTPKTLIYDDSVYHHAKADLP